MTTAPELAAKAAPHGIALFEDRLIFAAQPPITDAQLAEVATRVGRPIPPGLEALWRTAFGGSLGYDLDVDYAGHVHSFSFSELFYPGSDGYRDLLGWIDNEFDAARDADDPLAEQGILRFLPFGGFEYLERVYVSLEDGPDYGAVYAWSRGLPEAWALRLHSDSLARIADDVPALFRLLALASDPFARGSDYSAGSEMAEAIHEVRDSDPALADTLTDKARATLLDWQAALEAGTLAGDTRLRHLALEAAARDGDLALADRIATQGCDLNERYSGGGNLLDFLLRYGHDAAAGTLIERGIDPSEALIAAPESVSPQRTAQLLALGAEVTPVAVRSAAYRDNLESARLMADALAERDPDALGELADDLEYSAGQAETSAQRIESGKMGSNVEPAQYRKEAADLRTLRDYVLKLTPG